MDRAWQNSVDQAAAAVQKRDAVEGRPQLFTPEPMVKALKSNVLGRRSTYH